MQYAKASGSLFKDTSHIFLTIFVKLLLYFRRGSGKHEVGLFLGFFFFSLKGVFLEQF